MPAANSQIIEEPSAIAASLQVGLEVIVQKDVGQEKQWATILGWSAEQFLLLDGPAVWAAAAQLFPQNRLLVRFISLGSFYGFDAKVLVLFKNPLLVVTEWPRQLERMALSQENRYAVNLPVELAPVEAEGGLGQNHAGALTDISQGGCQVRLKRAPATTRDFYKGSLARLGLRLTAGAPPIPLTAEVRNTQRTGTDLVLGMRFTPDQDKAMAQLQLQLAPQLRANGAPPAPEPTPEPAPPAPEPAPTTPAPAATPPPARETSPSRPQPPPTPAATAPPARKAPSARPQPLPTPAAPPPRPARPEPPPAPSRSRTVPSELRVDTSSTPVTLEDISAERAAAILGVEAVEGSMLAVLKCRELVRAWVEKYGESAMRERRGVLLREANRIEGLRLVP